MVKQRFTTVVVTGPGGVAYSRGGVRVVDTAVTQPVWSLRSGGYRVAWRAISADGHPVQGEFGFTVALPAGAEPTAGPPSLVAAASTRDARDPPLWPWLAGGAAVLLAVAVSGVLVRRRAR
jgi:hypothetical protein